MALPLPHQISYLIIQTYFQINITIVSERQEILTDTDILNLFLNQRVTYYLCGHIRKDSLQRCVKYFSNVCVSSDIER